ncbi:twin-arginine translocation signal domain-containing protein [Halobacteriales archaeon Cl-PHB]
MTERPGRDESDDAESATEAPVGAAAGTGGGDTGQQPGPAARPPAEGAQRPPADTGPGRSGGAGQPGSGQPGRPPGPNQHGQPGGGTERRSFLKYGAVAAALVGGWFVYDSYLAGPGGGKAAVRTTLQDNIRGYETENLQLVRETTHPESPAYDSTIEQARRMFEEYELRYDLTIHSVSIDGDRASAEVTQTTRKVSGPEFRDNRLRAVHRLRPYQSDWRVYSSQARDVEYI